MNPVFVEVGHYQENKWGQAAPGDVFLSKKTSEGRIISVLSDGLGSGVKAGVLATLTATMALKFVADDIPIRRAAGIIMKTLPVCRQRRISYATFTIIDIERSREVRIIEYDNPPYILVRENTLVEPIMSGISIQRAELDARAQGHGKTEAILRYSEFSARPGDRLVFFSDGVSQSGMGSPAYPLGWGNPSARSFALEAIRDDPRISARELAREFVHEAGRKDGYRPKDDISCGVIYFREPRRLMLMTGPSIDRSRDGVIAQVFNSFPGKKIICGGTTANILSRELGRVVKVDLKRWGAGLPPTSSMDGADLVTEGIITLGAVAEILERPGDSGDRATLSPAMQIVDFFLDSDIIDFHVGTKINEAHQDPAMPVELEIRRNVVKKIASLLEERYLKETHIHYQ